MDKQDRKNGRLREPRRKAWVVDRAAAVPMGMDKIHIPMVYTDWKYFHKHFLLWWIDINPPSLTEFPEGIEESVRFALQRATSETRVPLSEVAFIFDPSSLMIETGMLAADCTWCQRERTIPSSTGSISSRCTCVVGPSISLLSLSSEEQATDPAFHNTARVRRRIANTVMQNTVLESGLNAWSAASLQECGWQLPRARGYATSLMDVCGLLGPMRNPLHG